MENDTDRAVIVGLNRYIGLDEGFSNLEGPEADARDFYNWVTSSPPEGAGVSAENVELIVSSQYPGPFTAACDARPKIEDVRRAFIRLHEAALKNRDNEGKRPWVGRRLYLFFAGHGITPYIELNLERDAAILMANASRGNLSEHVIPQRWLNWFKHAGYFNELVLFMDCCRSEWTVRPSDVYFDDAPDYNKISESKSLVGLATQPNSWSRERPIDKEGNRIRGVFTMNLLDGLRGAAADDKGRVTASSLKKYLDSPTHFLWYGSRGDPPYVVIEACRGDLVLSSFVKEAKHPVEIPIPDTMAGQLISVLYEDDTVLADSIAEPPKWTLDLYTGFYQFIVSGELYGYLGVWPNGHSSIAFEPLGELIYGSNDVTCTPVLSSTRAGHV